MTGSAPPPDLPRGLTLGPLLQWIMDHGIAARGSTSGARVVWTQAALARHLGLKEERSLRRWLKDEKPIGAVHFDNLVEKLGAWPELVAELNAARLRTRERLKGAPASPASPTLIHNLPLANPDFVGREEVLAELRQVLTDGGAAALTQARAITGLGGIGKTQTALAYAHRHRTEYRLIWWLRAEESAVLAGDYTGLARPLGLDPDTPDEGALIAAVRAKLEAVPRWLLIFDNAEDPAVLRDYLPRHGDGHVLLTSRRTDWRGIAKSLALDVLPPLEALALLLGGAEAAALDEAERAEAASLAGELGCLPLALAQARAYLDATGIGLAAYRRHLAARRADLLARGKASPDYSQPVALTWQASIEAAERGHAGARSLLELLAFFAPDAIPRDLLAASPEALPEPLRDPLDRDAAIGALARFSLLRADPATLTVHRLVQAVTADGLDEATARERTGSAVRLLNAALPRPPWEHTNWPVYADLLAHVLAATAAAERLGVELEATGEVLNETALYQKSRAAWAEAEPLFRRAIAIGEKTLGPEHPALASGLNNLANLYWATGCHAEAEPLYHRAIAIIEKVLGPEHPALAIRLNNLAVLYQNTGRLAEAEPLFRRAIAITEKVLGPEDPALAIRLSNLALLYWATGRHAEAEPLYHRAIAIGETILGPEHPDLASVLNNLALLYQNTGRLAEAEPLFRRAIAIGETTLGPEHHELAIWLHNLAVLYRDTGRHAEAEPLFRRALTIWEKTLPPDHPHLATASDHFARLLEALGRPAEAAPLRARAEAIRQQRASREGQPPGSGNS